jgi:hypothetical protein
MSSVFEAGAWASEKTEVNEAIVRTNSGARIVFSLA